VLVKSTVFKRTQNSINVQINCFELQKFKHINWTNSSTELDQQQHRTGQQQHRTGPTAAQDWTNSSTELDQQQHRTLNNNSQVHKRAL
jgi:hypothetical protein